MNVKTQTMAQKIDLVTDVTHTIVYGVETTTTLTLIQIRCAAFAVVEFRERFQAQTS